MILMMHAWMLSGFLYAGYDGLDLEGYAKICPRIGLMNIKFLSLKNIPSI